MPKLHLPLFTAEVKPTIAESLDTIQSLPVCGRQLNNHRSARAQNSANAQFADTVEQYLAALAKGQACRHCGREAGLVPKLVRVQPQHEDEDADCED